MEVFHKSEAWISTKPYVELSSNLWNSAASNILQEEERGKMCGFSLCDSNSAVKRK